MRASAAGPEADAVAAQARIALRGAAERAAALAGHKQAADLLEQALGLTTEPADRAAHFRAAVDRADTQRDATTRRNEARDAAIELHRRMAMTWPDYRTLRGLLGTVTDRPGPRG